jgi:protein TonB
VKRLFVSIVLALALHGLIFSFGGKWIIKKPYTEPKLRSVSISLGNQQLKKTPDEKRSPHAYDKKTAVKMERPIVDFIQSDDPVRTEAPAVSDSTANAVSGNTAQSSNEEFSQKYPKNIPGDRERIFESQVKEMPPVPVSGIVKDAIPLYKENPSPGYPALAKKRGYEGTVILEVLVTKDGRAGIVSVFQSSQYPTLDEAAVSSVKKWRFEPGKIGDRKVDMPVKIPIRFKLEAE